MKTPHERYLDNKGNVRYRTVVECPVCRNSRYVMVSNTYKKKFTKKCNGCNKSSRGKDNPNWKGGRCIDYFGYIQIGLDIDDPYYCMVGKSGYVREHRYVVAKNIGRPLERTELVHHLNGVKTDNRLENLELISGKSANATHWVITRQEQKILELEEELRILKEKRNEDFDV